MIETLSRCGSSNANNSRIAAVTNVLTKFHEDANKEKLPAPCGHVFQQTGTMFAPIQDIIKTNVLTKFHDYWTIDKNATPPAGGNDFLPTETIFQQVQDIIGTNLLTNGFFFKSTGTIFELCSGNRTINVASIILTRKTASSPCDIIGTKILTKFYEDRTINMASRVLTAHDTRRTKCDHNISP
ncbi:hypothetical protein DPMN_177410 [Dreissena polymorpha]|uniref:Uncharacterized protein n=1 Tax=Dreissena polymorpha TaxID=45954 RepID=A0A9D4IK61_DREPO|nr:hypothetical protein DPMN_177410 [Dreissena polymorpha]